MATARPPRCSRCTQWCYSATRLCSTVRNELPSSEHAGHFQYAVEDVLARNRVLVDDGNAEKGKLNEMISFNLIEIWDLNNPENIT